MDGSKITEYIHSLLITSSSSLFEQFMAASSGAEAQRVTHGLFRPSGKVPAERG